MNRRAIERWKRLKATSAGDGILEVPSIDSSISTGFGTARYAIGESGQPRLLIPIGQPPRPSAILSTPKLSIRISRFQVCGKATQFIDLMCQDEALDLVFAELAEEILRRLKEGYAPLKALTDSIDDFRDLLKEDTGGSTTDNKILGLVGELETLKRLTYLNIKAVDTWTGPYEARHDFCRGINALEIKTSSRSDSTKVCIHGIDQLSSPAGGTLHLAHIRLERVQGGPLSVGTLFDHLVKLGIDKKKLDSGLKALNCLDPYSEKWNRLSYKLEGFSLYFVSEGFPRIISSSFLEKKLPAGTSNLEYQIDLSYANKFELTGTEFDDALKRIAK